MTVEADLITFSFGKNWREFVDQVSPESLDKARHNIEEWVNASELRSQTVIDIGSGSGLHSLCFYLLGAKQVFSFDVDPSSVEATRLLWQRAGNPENWIVSEGSILDPKFISTLGKYDVVYSWGVLHHTGAMWQAIDNAASLVKDEGRFWLAIYRKRPEYSRDLELKKAYNRASALGKKRMEWTEILKIMKQRWSRGQNPLTWNERRGRGMNTYHDLIDWLGGLPYEVASKEEITSFCTAREFKLERLDDREENIVYLFSRTRASTQADPSQ